MEGKENLTNRPRRKIVLAVPADRRVPSFLSSTNRTDLQDTRITIKNEGSKTHRSVLSMGALPERDGNYTDRLMTTGNSEQPTQQSQLDIQHQSLNRKRHQRLAEITERCVEYKRRFQKQMENQLQRLDLIFKVSGEEVELKCQQAIATLQSKRGELMSTLAERQQELHNNYIRISREVETEISKIVMAHQRHQELRESDAFSDGFERDISQYAESIHRFYQKMKRIELHAEGEFCQDLFTQVVAQADTLLKNRPPQQPHLRSISFNNQHLFQLDSAHQRRQNLQDILKEQHIRSRRLGQFRTSSL